MLEDHLAGMSEIARDVAYAAEYQRSLQTGAEFVGNVLLSLGLDPATQVTGPAAVSRLIEEQ